MPGGLRGAEMKSPSRPVVDRQLNHHTRIRMNKSLLLASLISLAALGACGKKPEEMPAAPATAPVVEAASSAASEAMGAAADAASSAMDAASSAVDAAASAVK
jgi:predicted small lipoprotein YifL